MFNFYMIHLNCFHKFVGPFNVFKPITKSFNQIVCGHTDEGMDGNVIYNIPRPTRQAGDQNGFLVYSLPSG